ncbi:MAG: tyrosine-type recombinase/integrase family protein [Clostridia bacterium]|nr:tyrosine-type recombinase/integrase family protein [Clostridia bacterium]
MDKFELETFEQLLTLVDDLQSCFTDEDAYSRSPSPTEWRRAGRTVRAITLTCHELLGYARAKRNIETVLIRNQLHFVDDTTPPATEPTANFNPKKKKNGGEYKFSSKEIEKMPLFYKNLFVAGDVVAHWRNRSGGLIEIRCQIQGKKITASGKTKQAAAEKFIKKLNIEQTTPEKPITFYEYAMQFLETVKKPNVKAATYVDYVTSFEKHLFPAFGEKRLSDIKQFDVQQHLNSLLEQGLSRSAQKQRQLLKSLFEYAEEDQLVSRSPMRLVKLPAHETENGAALSKTEETELVERCITSATRSGNAFVFLLYTGLRRSELATARIEEGFVVVENAKQRKGRRVKTRSIPLSPRLLKFFPNVEHTLEEIRDLYPNRLGRTFKEWFPSHHLHELRHTFITRCQECGISRELTSLWAGHRADNTMTSNVYTHFSAEFQKAEILKFSY